MRTLNRVQLIGHLGSDPKIYAMPTGTLVARFSMSTQRVHKEKLNATNIIKKSTEWHSIVLVGNVADIAQRFLKKGTCIYVEGFLKTREYEDNDKNIQRLTEIIGDKMIILYGGIKEVNSSNDSIIPILLNDVK